MLGFASVLIKMYRGTLFNVLELLDTEVVGASVSILLERCFTMNLVISDLD